MDSGSSTPWTAYDPADLTGRARIRDAALAHFAEHGFAGASLRSIAEAANVSAGLVRHHFGSKEGLRQACDAYVFEFMRRGSTDGIVAGQIADPQFIASLYRAAPPILRYLARALTDGTSAGAALFDEIVQLTERVLPILLAQQADAPPVHDLRAHAAVLTAMKLGITVLHEHLSRALGADALSPSTWPRVSSALLDIVSPRLVRSEMASQIQDELAASQPPPTSQPDPKTQSTPNRPPRTPPHTS